MACRTCGQSAPIATKATVSTTSKAVKTDTAVSATTKDKIDLAQVVPKSKTTELVKIRYYGGGMTSKKTGGGCRACGGGKGSYTTVTTETIMFVSEDAPNSVFKQTFQIGHDYYVTRNQADYLLALTYRSKSGVEQHKFKEV